MFSKWGLIHRSGHGQKLEDLRPGLMWKTCLRQICIVPDVHNLSELAAEDDLILEGERAYGFLLAVICGLHSPLAGETEVLGQFKEFCAQVDWQQQPDLAFFREISQQLIIDAKRVRTEYLNGLGSQSYGSLARRWMAGLDHIHILGAGRLIQDILPWIAKSKTQVSLYVRNPEKTMQADWFQAFAEKVEVRELSQHSPESGGVIIGAPLSAREIENWLDSAAIELILDLRGDSEEDRISSRYRVQNLKKAFAEIKSNKGTIERVKVRAFAEIQSLAAEKLQSQKVRPFGWDDICA